MLDEVDIYLQSIVVCEQQSSSFLHMQLVNDYTASKNNLYQFISKTVSKTRNAPDYIHNKYTKYKYTKVYFFFTSTCMFQLMPFNWGQSNSSLP